MDGVALGAGTLNAPIAWDDHQVATLHAGLGRYARTRVPNDEIAQELVQETWAAALASAHGYSGRASVRTWLHAILRHKIIDRMRRRRPSVPLCDANEHVPETTLPALLARETAVQVLQALPALTPRQRQAVELCGIEELDRDEVARRMGLSRASLRVTLSRGRQRLRDATAA